MSGKRSSGVPLGRRMLAEFVGTALLLVAVVGSGIAASRLSPGDVGLQLLENAAAPPRRSWPSSWRSARFREAHLNPVVTLADRVFGGLGTKEALGYAAAQATGGVSGVAVADLMFGLPPLTLSTTVRSAPGMWLAEVVATFGLLLVVFGVVGSRRVSVAPFAVGAYIGGAYFFTASTSFANPAVTAARMLSDTFAGIAPASAPAFIGAQLVGAGIAIGTVRILYPAISSVAPDVVVPHRSHEGPIDRRAVAPAGRDGHP